MNITNAQFTAEGSITALVDGVQMSIPADAGNRHYAAMLEQGITPEPYPVPSEAELLDAERASMVCSPLQGQLALGETKWAEVEAVIADPETPWAMRVTIDKAPEWRRLSQSIDELAWLVGLDEFQTDDLFRAAMQIDV